VLIKPYETVRKCWEKKHRESLAPHSLSGVLRGGVGAGVSPKNESDRAPSENFLNMKMFKSARRFNPFPLAEFGS